MLSTTLLLAASMVVGQAAQPDIKYEKLKVLEPIIGTWTASGTYEAGASKWEAIASYSWSASQMAIEGEAKVRTGKVNEDISEKQSRRRLVE